MQTEIAFILDRSGSMQSMAPAAISGFNEFLKAQQATVDDGGKPIPATFSLILFDHEYLPVHHRVPIHKAVPLTAETYQPRGFTALLDAIGRTIDAIGKSLAALPVHKRPSKVIIAILTDGEENASQTFSMADVHQRITHQTERYQWEFLFLGANQDAIATAAHIGIHAHNSATFIADADDLKAGSTAFAYKISAKRRMTATCDISVAEAASADESMADTLEKSRKK
ncbi:MAG: hypothetical protein WCJ66_06030 [Verrucomicrobiota bacterium]